MRRARLPARRAPPSLPVVFEDRHVLVVNKPAGLASQRGTGHSFSVVEAVQQHMNTGASSYVGLVHRLDKVVTGLMVIAKTQASAQRLSAAIRDHAVTKEYIAVVCGHMEGDSVRLLEHSLVDEKAPDTSRNAVLRAQPLHRFSVSPAGSTTTHPLTAVKIELITGRKHQIRAQLSSIRHPIFADWLHGATLPRPSRNTANQNAHADEISLYCCRLAFPHPRQEGGRVDLRIPPPHSWSKWFGAQQREVIMAKILNSMSPFPEQ